MSSPIPSSVLRVFRVLLWWGVESDPGPYFPLFRERSNQITAGKMSDCLAGLREGSGHLSAGIDPQDRKVRCSDVYETMRLISRHERRVKGRSRCRSPSTSASASPSRIVTCSSQLWECNGTFAPAGKRVSPVVICFEPISFVTNGIVGCRRGRPRAMNRFLECVPRP